MPANLPHILHQGAPDSIYAQASHPTRPYQFTLRKESSIELHDQRFMSGSALAWSCAAISKSKYFGTISLDSPEHDVEGTSRYGLLLDYILDWSNAPNKIQAYGYNVSEMNLYSCESRPFSLPVGSSYYEKLPRVSALKSSESEIKRGLQLDICSVTCFHRPDGRLSIFQLLEDDSLYYQDFSYGKKREEFHNFGIDNIEKYTEISEETEVAANSENFDIDYFAAIKGNFCELTIFRH